MPRQCQRILVVNDDSLVLAVLSDALRSEGADVRGAFSAEEAADILERGFRPEVIVLDMQLGAAGADGEALLAWLRGMPELGRIPVVAISASPSRLRRVEEDVRATLDVPFSLDQLERMLREICEEGA